MTNQIDFTNMLPPKCEKCKLHKSTVNVKIDSVYPEDKEIEMAFIAEAPGGEEELHGTPLVGAAGQNLNAALIDAGINRDDVFLGNICRCLDRNTIVKTEEGNKLIYEIVRDKWKGKVLSVDINTGNLVYKRITNWYISKLNNRNLLKVSFNYKNNSFGVIGCTCTNDHKFLTNRGWVEAERLTTTDLVATGTLKPNGNVYQLFLGSLLGDASISKQKTFNESHGEKQKKYCKLKTKMFTDFNPYFFTCNSRKNEKLYKSHRFFLKNTPFISYLSDNFYDDNRNKKVPDIVSDLDLFGLSVSNLVFI